MASRGFLIRFIDIGLIVLFGFLMISEIETFSHVELSTVAEAQEEADDAEERTFVTVHIAPQGSFTIADPESGEVVAANIVGVEGLTAILSHLKRQYQSQDKRLVVLIRPHEDSVVQGTVDVMDVCDRLGLGKSLQMDLELGDGSPETQAPR